MSILKRAIEIDINAYIKSNETKILFIWGPRRSGKTTLINKLAKKFNVAKYNFDLASDRDKFAPRREVLEKIVKENNIILIDEVQSHPGSTIILKLLHDEFNVNVIATGSSELRQKSGQKFDSLAGRFNEIYCLPLSIKEIADNVKPKDSERENFYKNTAINSQIWGTYPEVYTQNNISENKRIDLLQRILDTYVLKDIVDIYELKNQKLAKDILTKVALQLGSEVSIREIANSLGAYHTTVSNYLEIFIKNYILIPLPSFKTNTRKAVSENRKLYFYDLGIRNMLIQDFRDLELRQDKGGVFENFIMIELEKMRRLTNTKVNFYFYREYGGKEIDLIIEDYKKNYITVEIKQNKGKSQDIFPIKNISKVITSRNYFEELQTIFNNFDMPK
jgi:uncharacterized protein